MSTRRDNSIREETILFGASASLRRKRSWVLGRQELVAIAHWAPRQDCRQYCVACRVLLVRIDVRSCLGAEAPSQRARRKPQVDSYLASPGLQSGEDRSLLLILALVRKHPVAGGPAALRQLKSAARRFQESAFLLALERKLPVAAALPSSGSLHSRLAVPPPTQVGGSPSARSALVLALER